jgi:threonine aldolase
MSAPATTAVRGFASDNYAGVHPDVLAAIAEANLGHVRSYGADPWTAKLQESVRAAFGEAASAFPVFNGTAANVLSAHAVCRPWESVICSTNAHLHRDECGAAESVAGIKLLTVEAPGAKITPEIAAGAVVAVGDEHAVQARVLSITQCTELGTVYTVDEVRALAEFAHAQDLLLHMDGARLFNAAVALGAEPWAFTTDAGVDLLSLGGTKAGLLGAEAVVFLRDDLDDGFRFLRKQTMQLGSKMRFTSAQLITLLDDRLWERTAGNGQRHGRAPRGRRQGPSRRDDHPARRGERDLGDPPAGGDRPAAGALALLRVGRVHGRGPLDVRLGHDGRGRRRVRGRRRTRPGLTAPAQRPAQQAHPRRERGGVHGNAVELRGRPRQRVLHEGVVQRAPHQRPGQPHRSGGRRPHLVAQHGGPVRRGEDGEPVPAVEPAGRLEAPQHALPRDVIRHVVADGPMAPVRAGPERAVEAQGGPAPGRPHAVLPRGEGVDERARLRRAGVRAAARGR